MICVWETPELTSAQEETSPLSTTLCSLFLKKVDNDLKDYQMCHFVLVCIPYW